VKAEALRSSLLLSRSVPKPLWFLLQQHLDAKSVLHRNDDKLVRLSYRLLSNHSITFNNKFNLKTVIMCLTLLKWICSHLHIYVITCVNCQPIINDHERGGKDKPIAGEFYNHKHTGKLS
jgi:hypothetical protein